MTAEEFIEMLKLNDFTCTDNGMLNFMKTGAIGEVDFCEHFSYDKKTKEITEKVFSFFIEFNATEKDEQQRENCIELADRFLRKYGELDISGSVDVSVVLNNLKIHTNDSEFKGDFISFVEAVEKLKVEE